MSSHAEATRRPATARPVEQAPTAGSSARHDETAQLLNNRPAVVAQRAVADRLSAARPNRTGLPDALKAGMEALSGLSMDDVRVHRNSGKPAQLQALAYAQGTSIYLGPGQERHLPHELAHVVQQKQGRVRERTRIAGLPVNTDPILEREADRDGAAATSYPARPITPAITPHHDGSPLQHGASPTRTPVQRMQHLGHDVAATVSGPTHTKHVVAVGAQQATATSGFGPRTFVAQDADLTGPVDLDNHNFLTLSGTKSAVHHFNANVPIYQFEKTNPPPNGWKANEPVHQTVDGAATNCEIGVVKTGDDKVSVTHFRMII